jgi:hypothetical protein
VQGEALLLEAPPVVVGPLAIVAVTGAADTVTEDDVHSSDSNKKQKTTPSRSADQAATAAQSRQTQ